MFLTILVTLLCLGRAGVMAVGDWAILAENLLTTELGVAFETPDRGYVAGDMNGVGPEILQTLDGGKTWTPMNASFGIDILLLAMAAAPGDLKTVVVTSVFGELYSLDGKNFRPSIGGGTSQSIRYVGSDGEGGLRFGCAGTYRGKQGVAMTLNGGVTFQPVFATPLFTEARYAAFPSTSVWYIAAGEWPNTAKSTLTSSKPAAAGGIPRARKSVFQDENGRFPAHYIPSERKNLGDDIGYKAQIVKTTDGGKTWTTVFAQNNTFYFNGIDCTSETHCCAVAESADLPSAGAYIYCTDDGVNWTRRFTALQSKTSGFSLLEVRFLNATLGWAVGGDLGVLPKAWFVETTDGGKTWKADTHVIPNYYALEINVASGTTAFAAIDNVLTQSSGVAKWTV